MSTKTYMARPGELQKEWFHVDASGLTVGRMANRIAQILMGKHKPTYTPHVDTGDFVIVTNAEKVVFTGRKWDQKMYRHHTGWVGGLVELPARRVHRQHPERIVEAAVRRMLPKTRLGRKKFKKLKVYAGPEHPHAAQQPRELELSAARRG